MNEEQQSKCKPTKDLQKEILLIKRNELSDDAIKKYREVDLMRVGIKGGKNKLAYNRGDELFYDIQDSARQCYNLSYIVF